MRAFRSATMTDMHQKLCRTIVHSDKEDLDVISTVDVQIHNTISEAASMKWDFDMKDLWLTKSRWSMMCRQYLEPEELLAWIQKCTGYIGVKGRGIATLRTKTVAARGGAATGHTNKETRRWGSCMLGITYKAVPEPQITLYSRTSYLGYLSALDLSVAWMCGNYLAKEMGTSVERFKFVWMNEALQYHNFKSLAYLLNHVDPDERKRYRHVLMKPEEKLKPWAETLIAHSPAIRLSRKWLQNVIKLDNDGKTLGDMNYNTYRRIRRRFHTEVYGLEYAQKFEGWSHYKVGDKKGEQKEFFKAYQPLPSVDVHTLDFSPLGLPFDKEYGLRYDPSLAEAEDDDDED